MNKKLTGYTKCRENLPFLEKNQNPVFKKKEAILKIRKNPYGKKITLLNCLKNIEVGELETIKKIQGKLYRRMKEYKKLTAEGFF